MKVASRLFWASKPSDDESSIAQATEKMNSWLENSPQKIISIETILARDLRLQAFYPGEVQTPVGIRVWFHVE